MQNRCQSNSPPVVDRGLLERRGEHEEPVRDIFLENVKVDKTTERAKT